MPSRSRENQPNIPSSASWASTNPRPEPVELTRAKIRRGGANRRPNGSLRSPSVIKGIKGSKVLPRRWIVERTFGRLVDNGANGRSARVHSNDPISTTVVNRETGEKR